MLLSLTFIFIYILLNSVINFCWSIYFCAHFGQNIAFESLQFNALFLTTTYEKFSIVATRFKGIITYIIICLTILHICFFVNVPSLLDSDGDIDMDFDDAMTASFDDVV